MTKHYSYPLSAALLLLGDDRLRPSRLAAMRVMMPDTPANTAHVDFYRGNIGHTGVSAETLSCSLVGPLAAYDSLRQE